MPEEKEKCFYFNSGYCKYKSKCKYLHPKEECSQNCKLKNCIKRHIKQCKFGINCKRIEKCAYKHTVDEGESSQNNRIISLEKTVKQLLEFKVKSEEKITSLQQEVISLKQKKGNETANKSDKSTVENVLKQEFVKLKSEFELLKLCQRKNNSRLLTNNVLATSSADIKCNICDSVFKTESGMKVHNDLVHQNKNAVKENLKCKRCNITCSDSEVMVKHNEREHKFKCTICDKTFKEEHLLKTHSSTGHAQKKSIQDLDQQ